MAKVDTVSVPPRTKLPGSAPAVKRPAASTTAAPAKKWTPDAGAKASQAWSTGANIARLPRAFVDATLALSKATNQREMVNASVKQNQAVETLIHDAAAELVRQHRERRNLPEAKEIAASVSQFLKELGPPSTYRLGGPRGTNGPLEDNAKRLEKLDGKLGELAGQLTMVNLPGAPTMRYPPNPNTPQTRLSHERARVMAFQASMVTGLYNSTQGSNSAPRKLENARAFFKALPAKVDAAGGPMERAKAASAQMSSYDVI